MKAFFIALILGIFIGSIATNYFASPDAYQKLKESKAALLKQPGVPDASVESASETDHSPRFEVDGNPIEKELPAPMDLSPESESNPDAENQAPETETTPPPPAEKSETPEKTVPPSTTDKPADNSPTDQPVPPNPETATPETPEEAPESSEETPTAPAPESENSESDAADGSEKAPQDPADTAAPQASDSVDLGLAAAIREQFAAEELLKAEDLQITVEDGHVTLTGKVPSQDAKRLAIEIAVFTEGVAGVEEALTVTP